MIVEISPELDWRPFLTGGTFLPLTSRLLTSVVSVKEISQSVDGTVGAVAE